MAGRPVAVAAIGLGFLVAAAYNAFRTVTGKFLDDLKTREMSESEERVYRVIGVVGHGARAVVFALIGSS